MATKDFDAQRTAALEQLEPIAFRLFGREWLCQPMLPPNAVMYIAAITEAANTYDILQGGLAFIGSTVVDAQAWDMAMRGAVIDGDTLLDLIVWLQGQYNDRYQEQLAAQPPKITAPTNGPIVTPPVDRENLERTLSLIRDAGGEIG